MTIKVTRPVIVTDKQNGEHELMPGVYNYGSKGQIDDLEMTLTAEALEEAKRNGSITIREDA